MTVFGIDPGSDRTGYGCIETDGRRHRLVACGAITSPAHDVVSQTSPRHPPRTGPLLAECRPDCVAIENLFYATNVRSALKLGHARGVAMVAAVAAGVPIVGVHPRRDQASSRRLRARRQAPGPADGEAAARPRRCANPARCRRRPRRRHLPRAARRLRADHGRAPVAAASELARREGGGPRAMSRSVGAARGRSGPTQTPEPEPGAWSPS